LLLFGYLGCDAGDSQQRSGTRGGADQVREARQPSRNDLACDGIDFVRRHQNGTGSSAIGGAAASDGRDRRRRCQPQVWHTHHIAPLA
jgi:hypothetical protein